MDQLSSDGVNFYEHRHQRYDDERKGSHVEIYMEQCSILAPVGVN